MAAALPAELPELRSMESTHRAFVLFHNTSNRQLELFWIDYSGRKVSFGIMQANEKRKIDTFVTHPWTFGDPHNRTTFLVSGSTVFYPKVWYEGAIDLVRMMIKRQIVKIHTAVRSLMELSMERIALQLPDPYSAYDLELPVSLAGDVEKIFRELKEKAKPSGDQQ